MRKKILIIFSILIISSIVFSFIYGGSNLDYYGYPSHNCDRPMKPYRPLIFNSQWEIDAYNAEVDRYSYEMEIYRDCIQAYIDNANNDIDEIRAKIEEAINDYNY